LTETAVVTVHDSVFARVLLFLSLAFDTIDLDTLVHVLNQCFEFMAQLLPDFIHTSLFEPKPFTTKHSGLDLTQLVAVCQKGQSWVRKNSSSTLKN